MARDDGQAEPYPAILDRPRISLVGEIDRFSVERFLDQLAAAEQAGGDVAFELTTLGGDPDMARRIVLEIDRARARLAGRFLFLGKTVVYSAGATIMAAFPCPDRWLSAEAMLMIHGRKLEETLQLSGPIRASLPMVEALLAQLNVGIAQEEEGFRRLVDGCGISPEEIRQKALHNWYLTAGEALKRGLIGGIVPVPGRRAG
ncbi:MAG TPA: ATP-dependent Clp protease proteolytic subunit [Allosphingosinicella sp.]|nr:ATP-dependent Clp protease proteolytic subunit [Allosphingosinicella sp.]